MIIIHVKVTVKSAYIEEFKTATILNAEQSVKEEGVIKFDVIQEKDDPSQFVLIEIYRTDKDPGKHKETAHYKVWRDTVESMMVEPRQSQRYASVFPID